MLITSILQAERNRLKKRFQIHLNKSMSERQSYTHTIYPFRNLENIPVEQDLLIDYPSLIGYRVSY